jgi:hypothetical protein
MTIHVASDALCFDDTQVSVFAILGGVNTHRVYSKLAMRLLQYDMVSVRLDSNAQEGLAWFSRLIPELKYRVIHSDCDFAALTPSITMF